MLKDIEWQLNKDGVIYADLEGLIYSYWITQPNTAGAGNYEEAGNGKYILNIIPIVETYECSLSIPGNLPIICRSLDEAKHIANHHYKEILGQYLDDED